MSATDAEVVGELGRVKVLFQARAIAAAMGFPPPSGLREPRTADMADHVDAEQAQDARR